MVNKSLWPLIQNPQSPWWDNKSTQIKEDYRLQIRAAWVKAISRLSQSFGQNPEAWVWGLSHRLLIQHALGKQAMSSWMNLDDVAISGGSLTLNKMLYHDKQSKRYVHSGPSTRRIRNTPD